MLEWWWYLVAFSIVVEFVLYFAAPQILAQLAFIPVCRPRRFELPVDTRIDARGRSPGGYRQAGLRDLLPADIPWPATLQPPDGMGGRAKGFAWVRLKYGPGLRQSLAVARVAASIEGSVVRLRAHGLPFSFITVAVAVTGAVLRVVVTGVDASRLPELVLVALAFVVLNGLLAWARLGREADWVMTRLEERFRDPAAWAVEQP